MVNALGRHVLLELSGCPADLLNDLEFTRMALLEAAERAEVTIVSDNFNKFNPHGISGVIVIAESHITIHTWPEYEYAAVDIFTCGDNALTERAVSYIIDAFKPENYKSKVVLRGIMKENIPYADCGFEKEYANVATVQG